MYFGMALGLGVGGYLLIRLTRKGAAADSHFHFSLRGLLCGLGQMAGLALVVTAILFLIIGICAASNNATVTDVVAGGAFILAVGLFFGGFGYAFWKGRQVRREQERGLRSGRDHLSQDHVRPQPVRRVRQSPGGASSLPAEPRPRR